MIDFEQEYKNLMTQSVVKHCKYCELEDKEKKKRTKTFCGIAVFGTQLDWVE